ncbi:molybdopterin-dependent oxidoreductase [Chitinophaga vietnamensis]|uniref:molybdopterin-dependent oxidoreductase n=1 Tax=Chitinophaga vietnamensis TaxID=2593957 RepID=UPI001F45AD0B|nr:molybdopterin-dependent oxidoreductase [Chitinophaga vietnamensis]
MMITYKRLLLYCMLCIMAMAARAQEITVPLTLKISGEVNKPLTLSREELARMKHVTVHLKDHDGKEHSYTGVTLQDLLSLAGAPMGKQLRGENLAKYLLVKCADGYKVVFSLAELDSDFSTRPVILAYEMEGKPLPADKGPFRVIAEGDKRPARASFQVIELVVGAVKD